MHYMDGDLQTKRSKTQCTHGFTQNQKHSS